MYLENQGWLEKQVEESKPEQGRKSTQKGSTKVQITSIRCKKGSSRETSKYNAG